MSIGQIFKFFKFFFYFFSSDPPNIFLCVGIGISYKTRVKLNIFAQPMYHIYGIKYLSFLKLVHQNKNELPGTSMAFTMMVSRFEKSYCLRKSSVPLLWKPNLMKTFPTGEISKLMIQTREPIPTYTLLNPFSLLWKWQFKHGVHATNFPFPWLITL